MDSMEIVKTAANALNDKKATAINIIEIDEISALAEYFVIATATSSTHVRALADEAQEKLSEIGYLPHHIEGKTTGWIVLDYSSVIIHVFTPDQREFYGLDAMWSDGKKIELKDILNESEGE